MNLPKKFCELPPSHHFTFSELVSEINIIIIYQFTMHVKMLV